MLTRREKQVMELVAWGASTKEISIILRISFSTVQNHVHNIKDKLNLQKSTEISAYYFCTTFNISFELSPLKHRPWQ